MRNIILSLLSFGILLTACQNNSRKQNKADIKTTQDINSAKDQPNDAARKPGALEYHYKSDYGEIVNVVFYEENYEKHVQVKREGQPAILLDQISATAASAVYEKDIYKFISQNEKASFTNGINFLKLTLISPLKYTFTNGEEELPIIYFSKDDKRFVKIKRINQPEITLEQTKAWAKGAEYGRGPVKWRSQNNTGTLITDSIETKFLEKKK